MYKSHIRFPLRSSYFLITLILVIFCVNFVNAELTNPIKENKYFKLTNCNEVSLFEATIDTKKSNNLIITDVNTSNFEIVKNNLILKAKKAEDGSAIVENLTSGTWMLCNNSLSYESISLSSNTDDGNKISYLVGAGALIGSITAVSLSGGSSNDSERIINESLEDNDVNDSISSVNSNTGDSTSKSPESQDNILLPDDSCSKSSLRSSRAGSRCGGTPDSIAASEFD